MIRRRQRRSVAAFTLLEMLMVIAIIALAAAVAMPALTRPSDGVRLQSTARDIMNAVRLTRAMAIARNAEVALTIDVDKRTFASAAIRTQTFAPDITAEVTFAALLQRASERSGSFRFFPDGSSTGGDVRLRLNNREATICVNWLTGDSQLGEHC